MLVRFEPVEDSICDRVIVVDPEDSNFREGDQVGHRCTECYQFDEDEPEIWHLEHCSLAGQGGRRLYDAPAPSHSPTPELQPEHIVEILKSAVTTARHDLRHGEPFAFVCSVCSNGADTLTETRHDTFCPLAGRHSTATHDRARADGGDPQ